MALCLVRWKEWYPHLEYPLTRPYGIPVLVLTFQLKNTDSSKSCWSMGPSPIHGHTTTQMTAPHSWALQTLCPILRSCPEQLGRAAMESLHAQGEKVVYRELGNDQLDIFWVMLAHSKGVPFQTRDPFHAGCLMLLNSWSLRLHREVTKPSCWLAGNPPPTTMWSKAELG